MGNQTLTIDKMKGAVISMCDRTGIMVRPWAEAGYDCYCIDVQHSIRKDRIESVGAGRIFYLWGDVRSWRPPENIRGKIKICFGFPPCTHLSSSGARDHQKKSGWLLADAIQIFDSIEVAFAFAGVPYAIENPVGRLSTHRRKPDYTFQPWEYGDAWFKKTGIWAGNGFVMPPKKLSTPPNGTTEKIWLMAPGEDRANLRSETPPGFAQSVFKVNQI